MYEEMKRITGVARNVAGQTEQSLFRYFTHVEIMEEERMLKCILKAYMRRVRVKGRPQV